MQLFLLICTFAVGVLSHTSIRLDPDFNVMFHMSSVPNRIEIEVTARTTGWVGFGFSHSGNMTNADMVIGGVTGNNESIYHGDYWSANGDSLPALDTQQDWFRNDSLCFQNETHTKMYYYRQLDTSDIAQDLVIPDEHIYLIWSYGVSDTLDTATRTDVYHDQINLVTGGSHHGGSSVIHASVSVILVCVVFYLLN